VKERSVFYSCFLCEGKHTLQIIQQSTNSFVVIARLSSGFMDISLAEIPHQKPLQMSLVFKIIKRA
jgi:hypothetical protein